MDISKLEPAERDPKKLRKTAIFLLIFIVVGGFLILWAYQNFGERTGDSERPSMEFKVTDDVDVMTATGEIKNIQDLKGKVSLAVISTIQPNVKSEASFAAMRQIMTAYEGKETKPTLLAFVIDADEKDPAQMASVLSEFDDKAEVWRIAAGTDGKISIRAFLKNRLRYGLYPEERDGEYVYDSKIVLLDQHLHIRGIPGSNEGWDFEKVAGMEEKFAEAQKSHPDKELIPPPMTTERLQELLLKSIQYLYANPDEKGQSK